MKQKLFVAMLVAIVLLMAALEHVAGRRTSVDASGVARGSSETPDAVSASPLLTR
jgi:hypothetical protein